MTTSSTLKAGPREWVGLAVLTIPALLAAMDLSVLFMAIPWLSADLEPSGNQLLWITDVYGFLMAGLLITMGTLGDRIGRRRLLMVGAVAFGVASILAAYSTSAEMLIAARALLGIGGATLAPSTLALIRNMFHDDRQRRTAVSVWAAAFGAGVPIGSVVGGVLVEHFWWGSVFLINIPVMVLLLVLAPLLLPEYADPAPSRFDLTSAGISLAAILPIIWGLKELAKDGLAVLPLIATGLGLLIGAVFVRRQRRLAEPLVDVGLFRRSAFSASIGSNAALTLTIAGIGFLAVQHLQLVLGYRPFTAALWMLPLVAAMMIGISLGTVGAGKVRPGIIVGAGVGVAAVGMAILARLSVDDGIGMLIAGYVVLGLGAGMALALAYNMVIATAPPESAGAAAALNETATEFGGALGIATLGSIAAAVYRSGVSDALPEALPGDTAAVATETLGGAVAIAETLPGESADAVLAVAREAFVDGMGTAAAVGAGVLAVAAVVVTYLLRRVRLTDQSEQSVH
jgi:DHA2 family multidrug resistance protein-like MFS transporter